MIKRGNIPRSQEDATGAERWSPAWAPELGELWICGLPPEAPGVAVVGARASDPYGLEVSARAAEAAVSLGRVVVSGGAEGCDRAAHEAAMAAGGRTLVVLAGGLDRPYPAAHRPLFDAVVREGGAVVSAYEPGTPPRPHRFLERNAVIAALCSAVIVTRARGRSGALSTARSALALGRPVLAVPGPVGRELSAGCNALFAQGATPMTGPRALARALRDRGGEDWPITDEPVESPFAAVEADLFPTPVTATPEGEMLLGAIREHQVLDLAGLSRLTRLPTSAVMAHLVELEIAGVIAQRAGRYRILETGQHASRSPAQPHETEK
jgi:DNA protecting protein DprA